MDFLDFPLQRIQRAPVLSASYNARLSEAYNFTPMNCIHPLIKLSNGRGEEWEGAKTQANRRRVMENRSVRGGTWDPHFMSIFFCNVNDANGRKPLIKGHEMEVKVCEEGSSDFL